MANTTWSTTDLSGVTLSGSDLIATSNSNKTSTTMNWVRAAGAQSAGKFYWENTMTTWAGTNTAPALANKAAVLTGWNATGLLALYNNGIMYLAGSSVVSGYTGCTSGAVVCLALDADAKLIWVRAGAAGNWNNSGSANPATGAGGVSIAAIGGGGGPFGLYPAATFTALNDKVTANFGDTAFTGTAPSGFTAGFTGGTTFSNSAIATQVALEQWASVATTAAPTGRAKVWNGSSWVLKPTKVWTGSAWVEKPNKVWNGSAWV